MIKFNVYVTTLYDHHFDHLYGIKNQYINGRVVSGQ